MRAALQRLARAHGTRRKRKLTRQQHPDAIARVYLDAIRAGPLAALRTLVENLLLPRLGELARAADGAVARTDAVDVSDILDEIREKWLKYWTSAQLRAIARTMFAQVARFNANQLNAQLRPVFGVDLVDQDPRFFPQAMHRFDAVDAASEDAFAAENVQLIKSIPSAFLDELGKRIARGLADGERPETLSAFVQERFGVAEARANLVARDQIAKLNGDLNQVRQRDLGITKYVWRTMRDERVRSTHSSREGEVFEWSDPPGDPSDPSDYGHPGQPIQCRCYPEPVLEGLL